MTQKVSINYIGYLYCLLPASLVTGPFIPDLIISISSIFFLFFFYNYEKKNFFNIKIFKLLIIFYIYIIFTSLFSDEILISLKTSVFYIRFIIFSYIVYFLINNQKNFLKNFFYACSITLLILILDSYIQLIFGQNILGYEKPKVDRLSGLFGDEWILGGFLLKLSLLFSAIFFYLKKKKINSLFINYLTYFILISVVPLLYFSGERSAFYLFLILLIYLFIHLNFQIYKKIIIILSLLTLFLVFIQFNKKQFDRIFTVGFLQIYTFSSNFSKDYKDDKILKKYIRDEQIRNFIASNQYMAHFSSAYKMFLDRPVLGHGTKMFRYKCGEKKFKKNEYSCTTHPHNTYLQLLAETGIIGAGIILICFAYILNISFKHLYNLYFQKNFTYIIIKY